MATPELDEELDVDVATSENLPWMCIVWDDPVNLMSYVSYVFQTVLGYDKKRANELMMQVHTEGKAAVSSGERDKIEADVKKLQIAGLWATMQQAGSIDATVEEKEVPHARAEDHGRIRTNGARSTGRSHCHRLRGDH